MCTHHFTIIARKKYKENHGSFSNDACVKCWNWYTSVSSFGKQNIIDPFFQTALLFSSQADDRGGGGRAAVRKASPQGAAILKSPPVGGAMMMYPPDAPGGASRAGLPRMRKWGRVL